MKGEYSMKNKAVIPFTLALVALIGMLFLPESLINVRCIASIVISVVALVLAIIYKKQADKKGMITASIVIAIICIVFNLLALLGYAVMNNPDMAKTLCVNHALVKDCVSNNDGTSTCLYAGSTELTCNDEDLSDSQYVKDEVTE